MKGSPILRVLEEARWAPSGDNVQSWRFEIIDDLTARIHFWDTRERIIYDFEGRPSRISWGALLETASIAASSWGWDCQTTRTDDRSIPNYQCWALSLKKNTGATFHPLFASIRRRTVYRRLLSPTPLRAEWKTEMEKSVEPEFGIVWLEDVAQRWAVARMLWTHGRARLAMPEVYALHKEIIEWNAKFSDDRIPDRAIGMDRLSLEMMRWALQSWERFKFLHQSIVGTLWPRIKLDVLPALCCGAHFMLVSKTSTLDEESDVLAGRAVQRFWLTADALGLQVQPEMTPLIFAWYEAADRSPSEAARPGCLGSSNAAFKDIAGHREPSEIVFFGRIGRGARSRARSLRLPLETLQQFDRRAHHEA